LYAIFAKYPADGTSVPHTHPDQRVVTVISGTYYAGAGTEFDESKLKPQGPGTTIIVPANSPHYAAAKDGETIVQEIGIGAEWNEGLAEGGGKVAAGDSAKPTVLTRETCASRRSGVGV
jgi:hypothetical protein